MKRVLLVVKTTLLEHLKRLRWRMEKVAHPALIARVESTHRETLKSRDIVKKTLKEAGIEVHERRPGERIADGRYDVIIVVGGDGTVLDVARHVVSTPILAVNASPSTSVGHFCCAVAHDFSSVLESVRVGTLKATSLCRVRIAIDGVALRCYALNDVLFAAAMPAETARYIIMVEGEEEEQKSSGVWVSTPAGSTGAVLSAGGMVMSPDERGLQYVVREPFYRFDKDERYRLIKGIVRHGGVSFISRMIRGGVFVDGQREAARIGYGTRVDLTPDGPPISIFLPEKRMTLHHRG